MPENRLLSMTTVVALLLFSAVQPAIATDGTPSWTASTVGAAGAGRYVSSPVLAFDHLATPFVSWSNVALPSGTNAVRLSQLTGLGLWSTAELATGIDIGLRTGLTFNRAEQPTVAWVDTNGAVVASFDGAPAQNVATGAAVQDPVVDLSTDLVGSLRGMFGGAAAGTLNDIGYGGGLFTSNNMLSLSGVSRVADAAIIADHRGLRQVIARAELSAGQEAVMLASEPAGGGAWPSTSFVTADQVNGVDIAVDPTDGRIAVAYSTFDGVDTSRLFYAKSNGFALEPVEVFSSTQHRMGDVSLAFDFSDGRPAIAYERKVLSSGFEELWFSFLDAASTWQFSLVDGDILMDAPGDKPRRPSLAFDDFGTSFPAIAYVDQGETLTVAFDPPAPEPASLVLVLLGAGAWPRRRRRHDRRA